MEMSYKNVHLAFDRLCYGGNKRGIHCSSPGEIVHSVQGGLIKLILNGLSLKKSLVKIERDLDEEQQQSMLRQEKKQGNKQNVTVRGKTNDEKKMMSKETLISAGVFGGQLGKQINTISRLIGDESKRQSVKDLPRTTFPKGITSRAKLGAAEQQGILYLLVIVFSSAWGRKTRGKGIGELIHDSLSFNLRKTNLGPWIRVLELLLGFE